jgi:hypothetical protein
MADMFFETKPKLVKTKITKPKGVIVDLEPLHAFERALSGEVQWRSRDGRLTAVKDMATTHIHHTVNMLNGQSPKGTTYRCDDMTRANWLEIFKIEMEKRQALPATEEEEEL